MKILSDKLGKPFKRFADNDDQWVLDYRDSEHTPYNKKAGQVDSQCTFTVHTCKDRWVSLKMDEITRSDSGRVAGRTISITLSMDEAKAIADFIKDKG